MGWPATSNRGYLNGVNFRLETLKRYSIQVRGIPLAHRATMGGTECLLRGHRPVDKVSVCYGGGSHLAQLTKITALVEAWGCSRTGT